MLDKTMTFSLGEDKEQEMKQVLTTVYDALREKGYNPINKIVGYLLYHHLQQRPQPDPQARPGRTAARPGPLLSQSVTQRPAARPDRGVIPSPASNEMVLADGRPFGRPACPF